MKSILKLIAFISILSPAKCLDFCQQCALQWETSLDKCGQCKEVVDPFKEGLKRTARGKHEGGDARWEESKLKNYAFSEVRFVDIQDHLCNNVSTSEDLECFTFAEESRNDLEDWFLTSFKAEIEAYSTGNSKNDDSLHKQEEGASLFRHLCIDKSQSCCEPGHYGPNCQPCPGFPDNVCHSRGICAGNGTRSGSGNCECFPGFAGKHCEKCAKCYFASGEVESSLQVGTEGSEKVKIPEKCNSCAKKCNNCDRSCGGDTCTAPGPKGCLVCARGFEWDEEYGCVDVDECQRPELNPCADSMYCVNTVGSYKCFRCHSNCTDCTGGPDSCIECPDGYRSVGSSCCERGRKFQLPSERSTWASTALILCLFRCFSKPGDNWHIFLVAYFQWLPLVFNVTPVDILEERLMELVVGPYGKVLVIIISLVILLLSRFVLKVNWFKTGFNTLFIALSLAFDIKPSEMFAKMWEAIF